MSIHSFSCDLTQEFFVNGNVSKKMKWAAVSQIARRKLDMLHFATELRDLRSPPGNRLEGLKGNFKGFWSIRINDQWRIIFRWADQGPYDVQICDYH
jgi:proteic killer suppression protein